MAADVWEKGVWDFQTKLGVQVLAVLAVQTCLGKRLEAPDILLPDIRSLFRGPQMGGQIRHGRIWHFWGAPIFSPEVPKYLILKGFRTSGQKIGAPQKRQIQPRQI